MKYTTLALLAICLFHSMTARAETWQQQLVCDSGSAVLDKDVEPVGYGYPTYQLVIRNPDIVRYLREAHITPTNANGEAIERFEAINSQEFAVALVNYGQPQIRTLRIDGKSLAFDVYRAESPSGGQWVQKERIGGWKFQKCD